MLILNLPEINCIDISDLHNAHPDTNCTDTNLSLHWNLENVVRKKKIDFLFFSGDQFDRLITVPTDDAKEVSNNIIWILRFCKKHNIRLRVLEGTPSHDRKQNYLFISLNEHAQIGCDVRYYDKLTIDYEKDFGINVLYVPDEWADTTDETLQQVYALLQIKQLEKVDLAIMHGMFGFQLPEHLQKILPIHDQKAYEKIVDQLIIIGHDHKHKTKGKVIVPGSFDRLRHGEEDPKGFVTFTLKKKGKPQVTFIENVRAAIYKSIVLEDNDVEKSLAKIKNVIEQLPDWSLIPRIRLVYQRGNPMSEHLRELKQQYAGVYWSPPKVIKIDEKGASIKEVIQQDYTAVILNKDNLEEKLINEVINKNTSIDLSLVKHLLKEATRYVRDT